MCIRDRIYDEEMPQEIRERIQQVADSSEMTVSATQNTPVFSVPPRAEPPQKEETADLYPVLAAQVLRLMGEFDGSRMGYGEDDAQAVANIAQQLHNLSLIHISNLQREQILPSEKAFAYKMKLDAMKRQAGRPRKDNSEMCIRDSIYAYQWFYYS